VTEISAMNKLLPCQDASISDIVCEFLRDNKYCLIAEQISELSDVPTDRCACATCQRQEVPMAPNHVTANLAIRTRRDTRLWPKLRHLIGNTIHGEHLTIETSDGVGTELHGLIETANRVAAMCTTYDLSVTDTCSCLRRMVLMNVRGIPWCRDNADTILEWIREECVTRDIPWNTITRTAATRLIAKAIHRAERKQALKIMDCKRT